MNCAERLFQMEISQKQDIKSRWGHSSSTTRSRSRHSAIAKIDSGLVYRRPTARKQRGRSARTTRPSSCRFSYECPMHRFRDSRAGLSFCDVQAYRNAHIEQSLGQPRAARAYYPKAYYAKKRFQKFIQRAHTTSHAASIHAWIWKKHCETSFHWLHCGYPCALCKQRKSCQYRVSRFCRDLDAGLTAGTHGRRTPGTLHCTPASISDTHRTCTRKCYSIT